MSKLIAYSLFDKKVGAFLKPYFARSVVEVTRSVEQLVKDKQSSLSLYPADFAVYEVGEFDETLGNFSASQPIPQFVCEVMDFVSKLPTPHKEHANAGT